MLFLLSNGHGICEKRIKNAQISIFIVADDRIPFRNEKFNETGIFGKAVY